MISEPFLKETMLECDVAIIGSGLVGLSCAASILEKNPRKKVIVFERGLLPTGASTKNAGIVTIGNFIDILDDLNALGEDVIRTTIAHRWDGVQRFLRRLSDEETDYQRYGTYEFFSDDDLYLLKDIDRVNKVLFPIFNENVFSVVNSKIKELDLNADVVKAVVYSKFDGQIDSGKTVKSLCKYVGKLGAMIMTGADVVEYRAQGKVIDLTIKRPFSKTNDVYNFKCKHLIIATNAFSNKLLKEKIDLVPARGQLFVTKPIPGLKIRGAFHFEKGYYYGRNIGDRILIGGARNSDYAAEETEKFETTESIISKVKKVLQEVILPKEKFEIEHQWAGIMGFGKNTMQRFVSEVEENVHTAVRFCGFGVCVAPQIGEYFSELILNKDLVITPKL